jgi:hypothetical protein
MRSLFEGLKIMPAKLLHCACGNVSVTGTSAVRSHSSSWHGRFCVDDSSPIVQIHKGGITVERPDDVQIDLLAKHKLDVVCTNCGCKLLLYASRKGAYCQFARPMPMPICGSLPKRIVAVSSSAQSIPVSIRPLFRPGDEAAFGRVQWQEEPADYDGMFGNGRDPFVGSYSGTGRFTTDDDYMRFVE